MKILISLSFSTLFFIQLTQAQTKDNILLNIEGKIKETLSVSMQSNDISPLEDIIEKLSTAQNHGNTHWAEYWRTYALYQASVFWAYSKNKDEDKAEAIVEDAISSLFAIKNKNSEDYALLGMLKGYSLQWKSMFSMAKESGKAGKWVEKAVELDDTNPRAFYTYGNNNYFMPAMFGGGKKADEYLTKAIHLYKDAIPNPIMPSWGMEDAYNKLIRTKIKNDHNSEAKSLLEEALLAFPKGRELSNIKL